MIDCALKVCLRWRTSTALVDIPEISQNQGIKPDHMSHSGQAETKIAHGKCFLKLH